MSQSPSTVTATEVVLPGVVEPSGLLVRTRPLPPPGTGQALIRVASTGISFAEQGMRRNRYPGQPKFPFVPGYDLVGTVEAVGPGTDTGLLGRRIAALTKIGGWASHVVLPVVDLVDVPDDVDFDAAETVVINGVTAWQMLHRNARVQSGQTVVVHGANGGVGTVLAQLAQHAGIAVIGTANPRHHDRLRSLGIQPLDYNDPDLVSRVRELAPAGVAGVFDNIGGASIRRSWRLLGRGGTLVCYGMASRIDSAVPMVALFIPALAGLAVRNYLPNGRRASFYNVWGGHRRPAWHDHFRADLTEVMRLLGSGVITAHIAARYPLSEVRAAMEFAESRTAIGKVLLNP